MALLCPSEHRYGYRNTCLFVGTAEVDCEKGLTPAKRRRNKGSLVFLKVFSI